MILKCEYSVRGRSAEEIEKKLVAISESEDVTSFDIECFTTSQG